LTKLLGESVWWKNRRQKSGWTVPLAQILIFFIGFQLLRGMASLQNVFFLFSTLEDLRPLARGRVEYLWAVCRWWPIHFYTSLAQPVASKQFKKHRRCSSFFFNNKLLFHFFSRILLHEEMYVEKSLILCLFFPYWREPIWRGGLKGQDHKILLLWFPTWNNLSWSQ
jgi:hypothetical protein